MRYRFDECLERGKIVQVPIDPALVEKELSEAASDLAAAERSLADHAEKWAIIQGYFSYFIPCGPSSWERGTGKRATAA